VRTQWTVGLGGVVGLRYDGCAAKLARFGELDRPAVWIGLEVIEAAYLAEQSRRSERERAKGARGGGRG
jgi:hypothetical protein